MCTLLYVYIELYIIMWKLFEQNPIDSALTRAECI